MNFVSVRNSFPAKLSGWKIDFSVGTGNVLPGDQTDFVHGVVHMFSKEHMAILDALEGMLSIKRGEWGRA